MTWRGQLEPEHWPCSRNWYGVHIPPAASLMKRVWTHANSCMQRCIHACMHATDTNMRVSGALAWTAIVL